MTKTFPDSSIITQTLHVNILTSGLLGGMTIKKQAQAWIILCLNIK